MNLVSWKLEAQQDRFQDYLRVSNEHKGGEGYIEQFLAYLLLHSDNVDFPNILAELEMSLNYYLSRHRHKHYILACCHQRG